MTRQEALSKGRRKKGQQVKPRDEFGLTVEQRKFCELRAIDRMSQAEAYMRSFPACKSIVTAQGEGHKLTKRPPVAAYIQQLEAEVRARDTQARFLSRDERRIFCARVVRGKITALQPDSDDADLIQSYEVHYRPGATKEDPPIEVRKIKGHDKLKAIQLDATLAGDLKDDGAVIAGIDLTTLVIGEKTLKQLVLFRKIASYGTQRPPQELIDELDRLAGRQPAPTIDLS